MAMVGHQTEAIYRRYAITDEAMLKDAGEQLAAPAREGKWLSHAKVSTAATKSRDVRARCSRARSPLLAVDRDGAGGGNRTHTGVKPTGF